MCKVLKGVDMSDPEGLRWMVLGYATNVMLGGGKLVSRAAMVVECFRDNFFDSKKAGLVSACYEVVTAK